MFTFYLFIVSMITLLVFYASAGGAAGYFVDMQAGTGFMAAERLMSAAGYVVSAGLLWLFHWRILLKERAKLGQTQDALLMAYLLLTAFMFSMGAMFQGSSVVREAGTLLARLDHASGLQLAALGTNLALTLVLWVHHLRLFMAQAKREVATATVAETN